MSKFQSTISTVAALASIFGAGAAGWKLAQQQPPENVPEQPQPAIEQKLTQLEQKLEDKLTPPAAVQLPPQSQLQGSVPAPVSLPPVPQQQPAPAAPEAPPAP